jgi:DNA-binding transcriptional LysR family regulator
VARGLGVAWLPSTAIELDAEGSHLTAVEVVDARPVDRQVIALERTEVTSWVPVRTLRGLLADAAAFLPGATPLTGDS